VGISRRRRRNGIVAGQVQVIAANLFYFERLKPLANPLAGLFGFSPIRYIRNDYFSNTSTNHLPASGCSNYFDLESILLRVNILPTPSSLRLPAI